MASSLYDSPCIREAVLCVVCQELLFPYQKQWRCSGKKPHITCNRCLTKLIEDKGIRSVKCPHKTCDEHDLQVVKPENNEYVHIFLDNSNFWIEAKKLASRTLHLRSKEDPRVRLDIDQLTSVVACGRDVASKSLYGSEPCKDSRMSTLWRKFKEHGWRARVSKRKGKEKAVDQELVASLTLLVSNSNVEEGTVVILCGDRDVMPAVTICLDKKWNCEVWMWKDAISKSLSRLEKSCPQLLKIICLDRFIDDITYTSYKFDLAKLERMRHLKSQAAVLLSIDFSPDKHWQREMTRRLRWPFECCRLENNDRDLVLVLVSSQDDLKDNNNAKEYFDKFFSILKIKYGNKVLSYVEYDQQRRMGTKREIPVASSNRYGVLDDELPRSLKDRFLTEDQRFGISDSQVSRRLLSVPDSTRPCCGRQDAWGPGNISANIEGPLRTPNGRSRGSSICSSSHPTSGYGSMDSPSLSRSTSIVSLASSEYDKYLETNDEEQDSEPKFTTVVPRRNSNNSSPRCRFKAKCRKGIVCRFRHTEAEKQFFKDPKKSTLCWWIKKGCNGNNNCLFAHDAQEGFCRLCSEWGHLENEECKKK